MRKTLMMFGGKSRFLMTGFVGLGLVMYLAGCDSADTPLGVTPAFAQTQVEEVSNQLAGTWNGKLDPTSSVTLNIKQDGKELWGDGIVFENDNPLPVELQGTVKGNSFEISLYPEAAGAAEAQLLQGQVTGTTARCFLGSQDKFDDRELTLDRDTGVQGRLDNNSADGLPQKLVVDLSHPDGNLQVILNLEDVYFNGARNVFEGNWTSVQPLGPRYIGDQQVLSGYLSGGSIVGHAGWCEFDLWDRPSKPISEVSRLIFRRPEGVGSRFTVPVDPDSWVIRGKGGTRPIGSHPVQKRQNVGGSVSPQP